MNKKTFTLVMMLLLAVMGAKADVIPSSYYSVVGEGTYFIYDVTSQKFVGRKSGDNQIIFEDAPTKTFTLTMTANQDYTIRYDLTDTYMIYNRAGWGNSWGSDIWMNGDGVKENQTSGNQYTAWVIESVNTNTYRIYTSSSYIGGNEITGGNAKYLQGGVWATESEESAHEYALISLDNYYSYLASVSIVPSSFFKAKGVGTYYIYNVKEGKFLRTVGVSENNKSLLEEPVAVTLTSADATHKGGGDYILSGNSSCFMKLGYWDNQWLWPSAPSGEGNILEWTFNDKGSNTFTMSVELADQRVDNRIDLAAGTYYMKNETNLSSNVGEAGLYALISTDDYYANLTLNENDNFSPANDIFAANVTVSRTISTNNTNEIWNTLVLPFDIDEQDMRDDWTVMEPTDFDGSTITFSRVNSIKAGKPYIFMSHEDIDEFSASNVTLKKEPIPTVVEDLTMTGVYTADDVPMGSYIIGINGGESKLYYVDSDVSIKPFRAYFTVPANAVKANTISLIFDDDATGIGGIGQLDDLQLDNNQVQSINFYDLQGRKVINPTKGIYIVNGKKVFIK